MPLLDGLGFADSPAQLEVAYRATAEPQDVSIEVVTSGASSKRSGPILIKRLMELINHGAAGGTLFAPTVGQAHRISGPWDGPDAFGPNYQWTLRIAGMAPRFLRTVVEQLRKCGWDQPVERMRIVGQAAPDDSAYSVRGSELCDWLGDSTAYVEAWPTPGFAVSASQRSDGSAAARVMLSGLPTGDQLDNLKLVLLGWLTATATYVDDEAQPVVRHLEDLERHLPSFDEGERVLVARYRDFRHAATPAAAVLINMLARFHATVAPIASVALSLGGRVVLAPPQSKTKPKKPVPKKPVPKKAERKATRASTRGRA